ncbi:MAG: low molecular weight phosphotyrosine protein phosphatase, partial [Bacteroidaceae bacterium]|nr:low molecular weight phosphotyrosine protein phosphatase [Bacteroidaceae bacterium]
SGSRVQILDMASFLREHQAETVPDPYYGGDQGFEYVIALLEDACAALLDHLSGN